jgi:hypothetical protein
MLQSASIYPAFAVANSFVLQTPAYVAQNLSERVRLTSKELSTLFLSGLSMLVGGHG